MIAGIPVRETLTREQITATGCTAEDIAHVVEAHGRNSVEIALDTAQLYEEHASFTPAERVRKSSEFLALAVACEMVLDAQAT